MLSKKAISQVLEPLQSRTTLDVRPSKIVSMDALRDAIHDLRTANSQIRRNQHLSNGYYLWINVVYHLDLTPYNKWRTYSFKNGPIQIKAIPKQLANYGFITLYDDTKLYHHDIFDDTATTE